MSVDNGTKVDLSGAEWLSSPPDGAPGSHSVEIAMLADGHVGMRDGKNPDGPVLVFTPGEWAAFTAGVRDGEFDRP
ncbi:DUF397 domain-containing protein [Nocardia sp. NPDC058499]|uniref:DUF397 domain-containing protein n=2 Tax=Nocardia TaxID=1817 RepID=A0A846YPV0_9NOCA|nr:MULTISPECIES: DUF397 domain-containing protein [Nocardia]NKY59422.1 DUF397 domain-containing protein [Nocardia flavorosea]